MNTYDPPVGICPRSFRLVMQPNNLSYRSRYTQSRQTIDLYGEKWLAVVAFDARSLEAGAPYEAWLARLRGSANNFHLWHFARPVPQGTMRGTPTLRFAALAGASLLHIQTAPGATLMAGDLIGCNGQILMVAQDVLADGTGYLPVQLSNRIRAAKPIGEPVLWDRPSALFTLQDEVAGLSYSGFQTDSFEINCEEWWA